MALISAVSTCFWSAEITSPASIGGVEYFLRPFLYAAARTVVPRRAREKWCSARKRLPRYRPHDVGPLKPAPCWKSLTACSCCVERAGDITGRDVPWSLQRFAEVFVRCYESSQCGHCWTAVHISLYLSSLASHAAILWCENILHLNKFRSHLQFCRIPSRRPLIANS